MTINVSLKIWIMGFMKGVLLVNFNLYGDQGGGATVEYFVNVPSLSNVNSENCIRSKVVEMCQKPTCITVL